MSLISDSVIPIVKKLSGSFRILNWLSSISFAMVSGVYCRESTMCASSWVNGLFSCWNVCSWIYGCPLRLVSGIIYRPPIPSNRSLRGSMVMSFCVNSPALGSSSSSQCLVSSLCASAKSFHSRGMAWLGLGSSMRGSCGGSWLSG